MKNVKVCVIHNTLNSVGGGERVCLAVIEALKEMDFTVTLVTAEPTDWKRIKKIIGKTIRPDFEAPVLPFKVKAFGIYMRLMTLLKLLGKRYDLTVNTHGDVLPLESDIIYMHYPTFALIRETPVNIKYSKSLFWRVYFLPYEKIQSLLVKKLKWKVLLTNSEFSKEAIRRYIGVEAKVLYPPAEIDEFLKVSDKTKRKDSVVICGRYTPEKNYELVLNIASKLPDVDFTIIGAYSGKISASYYSKLVRIKEKLRLKNIKLLKNVLRSTQVDIYSRSKVFMHTMVNEHFGIAVVEGMAAGLVPVVHRSGGPWYDIINRGKYGFGFNDADEAIKAIERAIENYEYLREEAVKRALLFRKDEFIKEFIEIVDKLVSESGIRNAVN